MELREELFVDDGFDCYAWAEEALIEHGGRVPELAQLVPPLALLSQTLARSVHASLQQLAVAAPQLQTQLDTLAAATVPLSAQLDAVVAHAGSTGGSSGSGGGNGGGKESEERALAHLVALHDAKQRLQACSQALVEAAKWEKNVRLCTAAADDIATALGDTGGDALPLADRVHEMRRSLAVLRELPGADDRRATMQALCARVEAALTPALLTLLREDPLAVAKVQRARAIFRSVDRADVVRAHFCASRLSHAHRVWFAFSAPEHDFSAWLAVFYSEVRALLQRESRHAREIFGAASAPGVLAALLQATFAALRGSFDERLRHNFRMQQLLRAFSQSAAFAAQTAQLFRALRESQRLADADAEAEALDGTSSAVDVHSCILSSVFDVYEPFFRDYARLARDALATELLALAPQFALAAMTRAAGGGDNDDNGNGSDDDDGVFGGGERDEGALEAFAQRVEDASPQVWARVDESVALCYELSAGAAFPEAVAAATRAVEQFARALSAALPPIRQFCRVGDRAATGGGDRTAPDWSKFHAALALLRACGALESDLCAMEIRVRARVAEQLSRFIDGFERHASFSLSSSSSSSSPPHGGASKKLREQQQQQLADLADGNAIAGVVARTWLHADAPRHSAFLQFAHEFSRSHAPLEASTLSRAVLFEDAQLALQNWTRGVQLLTFDTVFLPITRLLERVPAMESWRRLPPDAVLGDLPSFSTLPQEYITTAADLLLSLLPQLEQFAESSSLQKAAVASLGAHEACVAPHWRRLAATLHLTESEVDACVFIFTPESADATDGSSGVAGVVGVDDSPASATVSSSANEFVDLWTSAVASGTLAALLSAICAIPALSELGARQLSADLSYFHNVLSAVSGEQNFVVDDLRHALELSCERHAQHAEALRAERDLASSQVLAKLNESLVAKRVRAAVSASASALGSSSSLAQF
ncbi:hypothetical protein PybrP1_006747 [[Pythium] brassicae (nom. inval.)]|nr:hypothetical protein PybrP1_006747 [[Pythium] brassicae (nom. inval.)]